MTRNRHIFELTAEEAAKRIQWPLSKWPGNCYTIASMLVDHKVIKGTAVYGHWLGSVARGSMFFGKPIIQHGWILQEDGTVVDPTRFVFENAKPYIWTGREDEQEVCDDFESSDGLAPVCSHCEHVVEEHHRGGMFKPCKICRWPYDEGGNQLCMAMMQDAPDWNEKDKQVVWKCRPETEKVLSILFNKAQRKPGVFTLHQLRWLANVPYDMFNGWAPTVYKAIKKLGHSALIPIDNQRRAERESKETRRNDE